ncbi:MAG: ABC transporter ATP-binding protein [Chloroflexi bacterium]|nr:ABC transporter ATP-binding protein [Chloroflexota bacterium]
MRLALRNLSVVYPAPAGASFPPLPALGPLSFGLAAGAFVCVVGPSGCGKSTLVRVLGGLQTPTQGQALLDGQVISAPSRRIGLMFQDTNLMPWRTVLDNVALPLELAGISRDERYKTVHAVLPGLGLADFALAYPGELSGGMAQRAALGRVLVQKPAVLLLDEPFGALDAMTREQVSLDLLRVWAQAGQTVLMVTHSIPEAVLLADRILVLSRRPGKLAADIRVPLPRPRTLEDMYNEVFNACARAVRAAIEGA